MIPEISVIVPVLNEAKYLEATLQTIVNQNTNVNYELIVSDNGSTVGTDKIRRKSCQQIFYNTG